MSRAHWPVRDNLEEPQEAQPDREPKSGSRDVAHHVRSCLRSCFGQLVPGPRFVSLGEESVRVWDGPVVFALLELDWQRILAPVSVLLET